MGRDVRPGASPSAGNLWGQLYRTFRNDQAQSVRGVSARRTRTSARRQNDDLARQRAGLAEGVVLLKLVGRGGVREWEAFAPQRVKLLRRQPLVDVVGTRLLLVGRHVEHREPEHR